MKPPPPSMKPIAIIQHTEVGAPGALAKDNATRNPSRTARTAGALMIGLALVTLVATLGASLKSTDRNALKD